MGGHPRLLLQVGNVTITIAWLIQNANENDGNPESWLNKTLLPDLNIPFNIYKNLTKLGPYSKDSLINKTLQLQEIPQNELPLIFQQINLSSIKYNDIVKLSKQQQIQKNSNIFNNPNLTAYFFNNTIWEMFNRDEYLDNEQDFPNPKDTLISLFLKNTTINNATTIKNTVNS